MIHFNNDQGPSWEELQSLGLKKEITSREQFMKEVEGGYATALDSLQNRTFDSPNGEHLRDLHKAIFANVIQDPGRFQGDDSPQHVRQKLTNIDKAAEDNASIRNRSSDMAKVNGIAEYAACVMKESPFPDTKNSFVNRTVVACVMESQLEHSFGQDIKREVDANTFGTAIDRATQDEPLPRALKDLVRDMTNGKANVIDMQKWQQEKEAPSMKRDIERDR